MGELNAEKQVALDRMLAGGNFFVTGKAGTGKTRLICEFLSRRPDAMVVAPTGLAALNAGGLTIHRFFGLRTDVTSLDEYDPGRRRFVFARLTTLVVDEASMMRADTFDLVEQILRRYGPLPGFPFGGVQMILVGDVFQLPPVVVRAEEEFFTSHYASPFFFSGRAWDVGAFSTIQLSEVFRQSDEGFVDVLNRVRAGDEAVVGELDPLVDPGFVPQDGQVWVTLAGRNRRVDSINEAHLDMLDGEERAFEAVARGCVLPTEIPVARVVRVAVGAQVMCVANDPDGEFVNGSVGMVRAFEGRWPVVELEDGSVVVVGVHRWPVTRPKVIDGRLVHEEVGAYFQVPLRAAWAMTVHKAQGKSLSRMVFDPGDRLFAPGQLYVALSRARSREGLVLRRRVEACEVLTDPHVLEFSRA